MLCYQGEFRSFDFWGELEEKEGLEFGVDSIQIRERGNTDRDHEYKAFLGHCNFPVFIILVRSWLLARRRTEGHVLAFLEATVLGAMRREHRGWNCRSLQRGRPGDS